MAKNSVYSYSSTAASNTDIGGIDTDEGMAPSDVNNAIREMMAQLRELTDNLGGLNVSAGTDTVTLTSGMSITAYAQGQLFGFEAGGTNTTAVTLNVDSVGAKAVVKNHDVALAAGDIEAGQIVLVAYEATADNFQMISPLGNQALFSLVEDTTPQLGGALDANGNNIQFADNTGIVDDNGNEAMIFQTVASAVNYFDISPSAAGGDLIAAASGTDTNIDIDLQPKGAGLLLYGGTEIAKVGTLIDVEVITTTDPTWTPPAGATKAYVIGQGPGGGSGGIQATGAGQVAASNAGAAGGRFEKFIDLTAITSANIQIGAGGVAGSAGVNNGSAGGATSWSDGTNTMTANGGNGGNGGGATTNDQANADAPAGGTATGGDINVQGDSSGNPFLSGSGGIAWSAPGASSLFGPGGKSTRNTAGTVGGLGAGAAGASSNPSEAAKAGAEGGNGVVVIYLFK